MWAGLPEPIWLRSRCQVPLNEEELAEKSGKPEKMSIGGEGGFQVASAETARTPLSLPLSGSKGPTARTLSPNPPAHPRLRLQEAPGS